MDPILQRALDAEQVFIRQSVKLSQALKEFEAEKAAWEAEKAAESEKLKHIGAELKKEWAALHKAKAKKNAAS